MAYVGTILGLGSITGSAAGLGFLMGSSIIGLVSFAIGKAQVPDPNDITYSFKIGLDGAGYNEGYDPLAGAGGGAPGVRAFDNQGRKIGQTRHRKKCVDGQDYCTQVVKDMPEQPAYALITGRSDPVCVAAVGVTYPSGDKYGWVGNWAHTCSQPWYYSDIDAQYENGTIKLDCVWLGSKGYKKGYSTGIRIHFPEFKQGREANGHNEA
ncbi:hypothetical protein UVI_02047510 [Ustilaginoidea virens]|nr:hypothetical protein UVI_02047510 [Ustilaginoidea virens]